MRYLLLVLSLFILTGCNNSVSKEKEVYDNYITELETLSSVKGDLPFNIEVYVDKIIETEVMYRVIIDKPKIALRDIEALVIHDKYTEDVFPSSGIFDTKYSLIPDVINKSSNYMEGIILIGYIPYEEEIKDIDVTFKILFKYKDDDGKEHTITYSTKR